jgi:hypothetical protein
MYGTNVIKKNRDVLIWSWYILAEFRTGCLLEFEPDTGVTAADDMLCVQLGTVPLAILTRCSHGVCVFAQIIWGDVGLAAAFNSLNALNKLLHKNCSLL